MLESMIKHAKIEKPFPKTVIQGQNKADNKEA